MRLLLVAAILFARVLSQNPEQILITPSDGRGDANFGKSLSVYEDTMAVGSPGDNRVGFDAGVVYMFDFVGGEWSERSVLVASSGAMSDKFGTSVSIFEDTVAVGAVNRLRLISGVPALQAGAVYIFLRSGNVWSESQLLLANDGQEYDHFGIKVSLYQNSLLIGASDDNIHASTSAGSVYLFSRSSATTNFIQKDKTHASDAADGDKFGFAIDLYDKTAAVGAYQDDDQGSNSGSVYIYSIDNSLLSLEQKITAPDHNGGDNNERDAFGFSLSLFELTLAVSSFFDDDAGHESGAVYVFLRDVAGVGTWTAQSKLLNSDVGSGGEFGYSVDVNMDELVVGAAGSDSDAGAAYVYQRLNDQWHLKWEIVATDQQRGDALGVAVALDGRHVVVSTPENDDNGLLNSGSIYYAPNIGTPTSEPSRSMSPTHQPSGYPSMAPATSIPTLAPITPSPSSNPVSISPTFHIPTGRPSDSPTTGDISTQNGSSGAANSSTEAIYITVSVICGVVLLVYAYFRLKKFANLFLKAKPGRLEPVIAEAEIISGGSRASSTTNPRAPNIASVYAIESAAPTPRKKKKRSMSNSSVTPVLPFATHVSNHIPVAESV